MMLYLQLWPAHIPYMWTIQLSKGYHSLMSQILHILVLLDINLLTKLHKVTLHVWRMGTGVIQSHHAQVNIPYHVQIPCHVHYVHTPYYTYANTCIDTTPCVAYTPCHLKWDSYYSKMYTFWQTNCTHIFIQTVQ